MPEARKKPPESSHDQLMQVSVSGWIDRQRQVRGAALYTGQAASAPP